MTEPARETLRQPFAGDRPGVTFYSVHAPGAWHGGAFPLTLFDGAERNNEFVMHGESWEIVLWDVTFRQFPSGQSWRRAIDATFAWICDSGGVVAWIGDGVAFAAPPTLFDQHEMSNAIFEASTCDGQRVGWLDLDAPAEYLEGPGLAVLRTASGGLATAT